MTAALVRSFARLGIALGLLLPAAGWACSLAPGYRAPTNFELVERAALIVIAQVDSGPEGSIVDGESRDWVVRIGPMQVLKGVLPKAPLTLEGIVSSREGRAFESAPTPLATAHHSVRLGACTRQHYAKGGLVLALYEKSGEGLHPVDAAFSRAVEDIESYDSLWVRAVRLYVALQQRARGGALRKIVIAERDRLRARAADMESQAIAADLDAWLERGRIARGRAGSWLYEGAADRVGLVATGPAGTASLRCRRGGQSLEIERTGEAQPKALGLMVGERAIEADKGRMSLTPELDRLFRHSAGPFAVMVDGQAIHRGRAGDAFQKLALRCQTLLKP